MRFEREGVTLDYSDEGCGMAVVLIHGFANDRTLWRPQVNAFKDRYRLIVPSLRGFGESTGADGTALSMDTYADDIASLLDHLQVPRAVVGGISLGGYISLAFVLRHPGRTLGLVLANTRAGADPPEWAAFREEMVRTVQAGGAEAVVASYGDKPFSSRCPETVKEEVRQMIRRQPVSGLIAGTLGMAQRPDRTGELASIRAPALIIHGTEDRYIPPEDAEVMHRALPGSRYANIEGAGHLSNVDSPAAFNEAIESFLAALDARVVS